jgi:hypothetical protein
LELPIKIKLDYLIIHPHPGSTDYATKFPAFSNVYGSNDDIAWTELTNWTVSNSSLPTNDSDERKITVNATNAFKYIALVVTGVGGTTHQETVFNGLEYYGHEEGDSSLDTTLKSVYNVPGTQQLEVYYDGQDFSGTPSSITDKSGNNITATANNRSTPSWY